MEKIQFFTVDPQYIAYLQAVDPRVPDVVYPGRHKKMLCGIVLHVNGVAYYAPLSSNKAPSSISFLVCDRRGKAIASLRFQYMIPVPENVLTKVDFSLLMRQDPKYGSLVMEEYRFCNKAESIKGIMQKAKRAYRISSNTAHDKNRFCCDFAALEAAMLKYTAI